MNQMTAPRALKKGSAVALVAPAGPAADAAEVRQAVRVLEEMGYEARVSSGCYAQYGYLAGQDEARARELNAAFADPEIEGIFCMRGGYGCSRILDRVDYDCVRRSPKVFVGYSDITALHIAFNRLCGLLTFHGPMPGSDAAVLLRPGRTREGLLRAVGVGWPLGRLHNPGEEPLWALVPGRAAGRLAGGNLSLAAASLGTPYEIDTRGCLLFLEEIGEYPYRVDRMLSQLRLAGKFRDCCGVVLGDFRDCGAENPERSLELRQIFDDLLVPEGKPVLCGLRAGHCVEKLTLPLGAKAEMDAGAGSLRIVERAVC